MKYHHLALLAAVGLCGPVSAAIQYFSYTGTRNSWTGSHWSTTSGGSYVNAWGGYNEAILEGTGGTVSGGGAVNKWTFNADGYNLTGGFTMGSPGTANFIISNAAHTATVNGLSYANTANILWKDGAGKLILGGTNSAYKLYAEQGTLEVSSGTTTVANDFNVGRDSFGTATTKLGTFLVSGGSLVINGANFMMGQTVNGANQVAQFTQTNGSVTFNGSFMGISNGGGVSKLDLSGGSFTSTTANMALGVRNNATLNISGSAAVNISDVRIFWADAITGTGKTGTINLDGGTLTTGRIWQASGVNTSTVNFNSGTLKASSANAGFLTGLTAAYVKIGGAKIDTNTFDITIGQALLHDSALGLTADGGLTKSNTGTLTLTGTNTYTGDTTVNGGRLVINGSISTSNTTVKGGTLGGVGTVGAVSIESSGVAPGNSPGTMTFTGDLDLNNGSISNFEINAFTAGNYDLALASLAGTQNVTFDGGTLNLFFNPGFNTLGTVKIFDFDGYFGSGFTTLTTPGLASGFTANFNAADGTVTVVPETRSAVIGGLGLLALLRRRRSMVG